jgi:YHS domain-containing protein/phenylpyruvate tautomerase PptA (4-oxalocrotonate tautomerase family)
MMFTEVFVPKGALREEERARLAERLTLRGLHGEEGADPGVLDFLESITHVVVHEVDVWVAGGRRLGSDGPPRYVVRVHVPGPWRKSLSESVVEQVTRVLAESDPDPDRLRREPHAEVHVLGVPDGGYGAFGRVVGDSALGELISEAKSGTAEAPPGMAIDPVCGATVPLDGPDAVTVERDGTTHAFCCPGCRKHFLDQGAA